MSNRLELLVPVVVWEIAKPLLITVVILLPMLVVGVILGRRKRRYLALTDDPFTDLPLRPPGESLRARIDALSDTYDEKLFGTAVVGAVAIALYDTIPHQVMPLACYAGLVIAAYLYFGRDLLRIARQIWDYRLGYKGERVVAEELNQLTAAGFRVFHDLPFDGFNVDHVIVGVPGVYVVETKTRRKPTNVTGVERATVTFDGTMLKFPNGATAEPLEQARRNAKAVSAWLSKATGEPVFAGAIVTLPGWWVDRRARGDVNVLNPVEVKHSFPTRPNNPLSAEQIQRIAHQITERCRMTLAA
ncbi:MAG TPA: NERD domain-containing protein [Opitutaceae bacterium]|nr:NERD domain-containing protein [Opitutaceae bacterium]